MAALAQNVETTAQIALAQNLPESEFPVSGVAVIPYHINDGIVNYLGFKGDRLHMTKYQRNEWESHFYKKDEGENPILKGAPHSIFRVKPKLILTGKEYDKITVAMAMLKHCVKKGWMPKLFGSKEEARSAVMHQEYAITGVKLILFHNLMVEFTNKTAGQDYVEFVVGGREKNESIIDCLQRELEEESGLKWEQGNAFSDALIEQMTFIGYSEPFGKTTKRVTAVFGVQMSNYCDTLSFCDLVLSKRRPTGFELLNVHSYFKYLPGINVEAAKEEKSTLETHGMNFYPMIMDRDGHAQMDVKNIGFYGMFKEFLNQKFPECVKTTFLGHVTLEDYRSWLEWEKTGGSQPLWYMGFTSKAREIQNHFGTLTAMYDIKFSVTRDEFLEWKAWQGTGGSKPSWFMSDDIKALEIMNKYDELAQLYTPEVDSEDAGAAAPKTPSKRKTEAVAPGAPKKPKTPTSP